MSEEPVYTLTAPRLYGEPEHNQPTYVRSAPLLSPDIVQRALRPGWSMPIGRR